MAKDAIDAAADALDGRVPPSATQDIPLLGAEGYQAAWNKRGKIARAFDVHKVRIEHLLNRYGTMTDELLDLIRADASLGEPLPGADDYLGAEVVYAASHEGALHLDDVLARRTRISIEAWDRGVSAAPVAAKLMGGGARLGHGARSARGRAVPAARRRGARLAGAARRRVRRPGATRGARHREGGLIPRA